MAGTHWKYGPRDHDDNGNNNGNNGHYNHSNDNDSDPNGNNNNNNNNDESPTYYHYVPKAVKKVYTHKVHKVYDPGAHAKPKHKCPPIICDPQYVVRDCYVPRVVHHVHPIVNINRHIIVNVPRHVYQPVTRNVVVDPGCPCPPGHHRHGQY